MTISYPMALLATFLISTLPALELRVGIPAGVAMGLSPGVATITGIAGNFFQIPIAIWFVRWAYRQGEKIPFVARWLEKAEATARKYADKIQRYGWVGLAVFVFIPIPGTGAWTGAVVARLLQMNPRSTYLGLLLGVAGVGALIGAGTWGVFTLIRTFW